MTLCYLCVFLQYGPVVVRQVLLLHIVDMGRSHVSDS